MCMHSKAFVLLWVRVFHRDLMNVRRSSLYLGHFMSMLSNSPKLLPWKSNLMIYKIVELQASES